MAACLQRHDSDNLFIDSLSILDAAIIVEYCVDATKKNTLIIDGNLVISQPQEVQLCQNATKLELKFQYGSRPDKAIETYWNLNAITTTMFHQTDNSVLYERQAPLLVTLSLK